MRRRPANAPDDSLDIFDGDRFIAALAGATQPAAPASAEPSPPHPVNPVSEAPPEKLTTRPDTAPQSPPATTARSATKGWANRRATAETPPSPEPNVPLKFRVPQTLRSEFHRFKAELAVVLGGVALDDSNLARPLVEFFLLEQGDRILEEAAAFRGHIRRPPNGDAVGMAEFDHAIGEIFRRARRRRSPGTSSKGTLT